ncbi:MAG: hypothetical protein AAGF26_16995, partial [Cyanobacteria bacterium P01_G01_bin.49]
MKSWEFLIQKEGDHQWESVNSPNVQIEEVGKYRILAHTNRFNRLVEVRIRSQEGETQYYQRRVNSQGLVMILPFTEFSAGTSWNVRCCNDILSELLGESWQEQLKLDILPFAPPTKLIPVAQNSANFQTQDYVQQLERLLREEIEPKLINLQDNTCAHDFNTNLKKTI